MVAPAEWDRFLAEVVTPRFPDGLTVWEAEGQWRGKAGELSRDSWVLLLVHADSDAAERAVREINRRLQARVRAGGGAPGDQPGGGHLRVK